MPNKKVFVSGCYDLLHSGHIEFFIQASRYGDLYVGIGSDETYLEYKHRKPMFPQEERLFMVKSIKYVKDAYINAGSGVIDYVPTLDIVKPDIFVVNAEGGSDEKRRICEERGIQYVELERPPHEGLQARSSSSLKATLGKDDSAVTTYEGIPTRLDLAGTWIDQPYVSCYHPGWAITISIEPSFEVRDRCGLSTSTRKMIQKIWPVKLPKMDPEMLARLVFCFEKEGVLEREDDDNSVIPVINSEKYARLKADGVVKDGMIPKLDNSFDTLHRGVKEVIITKAANLTDLAKGTHIVL